MKVGVIMHRKALRKDIVLLSAALCILLVTLSVLFILGKKSYGHLCIYVTDAYTLKPISQAVVILPESGMQSETDEYGKVEFYHVPIVKNKQLDKLSVQNFGQTSVLCFSQGYQPYALFYAQIQPNRVREGPTLYMFPEGTEAGCVIEAPPEEWIKELFSLYDPFNS